MQKLIIKNKIYTCINYTGFNYIEIYIFLDNQM